MVDKQRYNKDHKEFTKLLTYYGFEEKPPMEPKNWYQNSKQNLYLWLLKKRDRPHHIKGPESKDPTYSHLCGWFFKVLKKISPIKMKRKKVDYLYFIFRGNFNRNLKIWDIQNQEKMGYKIGKVSKEIVITLCPFNKYRVEYHHKGYGTFNNFFETIDEVEKFLIEEDSDLKRAHRDKRLKGLLN